MSYPGPKNEESHLVSSELISHFNVNRRLKSPDFHSLLHLRTLSHRLWLSNHDVHLNRLRASLKGNHFLFREVMLLVVPNICLSARFKICCAALKVSPGGHMLDQLLGITLSTSTGLGTKVHEIVGFIIAFAKDIMLCVVQEGQKLVVETGLAFGGELVPESPHTAPEDGPEIIHVLSRWHPIP
jgi:hypothetical protein